MPDQYKTTDLIQGKVLAALPWEGGRKTEAVARHAGLGEDIVRRALEDLVRRRIVTIDDRNYWRKKTLRLMSARASPVMHHSRLGRVYLCSPPAVSPLRNTPDHHVQFGRTWRGISNQTFASKSA